MLGGTGEVLTVVDGGGGVVDGGGGVDREHEARGEPVWVLTSAPTPRRADHGRRARRSRAAPTFSAPSRAGDAIVPRREASSARGRRVVEPGCAGAWSRC